MRALQEWSYLRGGLSTLDRDYGIFNNIHHDIGTHVVRCLSCAVPSPCAALTAHVLQSQVA